MQKKPPVGLAARSQVGFASRLKKDVFVNRYLYLMLVPVVGFYVIFHYAPMYGAVIAFMDYNPAKGVTGSKWIGLQHFTEFFNSYYIWRLLKNTFLLSFYSLLFGFPAPIIFALLINELRVKFFQRTVQTITYMPHFISTVVIAGIVVELLGSDGLFNNIIAAFGGPRNNFMVMPEMFRTIYVGSGIWTDLGWGSIIYLAAITTVNPHLYEAAAIDGAGRFRQAISITIPSIMPTVVILLILQIGGLLNVGWEKVLLLYNPVIYDTADIISTYVYRRGLEQSDYSYSAAIGLFNSVINFALIYTANRISRKVNETSVW